MALALRQLNPIHIKRAIKFFFKVYWEMKFLKQSSYIQYVIAKLSKLGQISRLTFSDSFILRIIWKLPRPGSSFQATIFIWFFYKTFFFNVTSTGQISLPDCVCFPSYSIKCVSCFMHRHLMISWHLNM